MPRHNELLERLVTELAICDEPAMSILMRLGVSSGAADRLLQSKAFGAAVKRLNRRMTACRDLDLGRAASVAANNVLRGIRTVAEAENLTAEAQRLSTTAVRLAHAGERLGALMERLGTKGNKKTVRLDPYRDVDPALLAQMDKRFENDPDASSNRG